MNAADRTHQEALLSDDVYRRLKDYILCDVARPAERLQIGQLSRHFGVSITPIREALIRLAAEEIVVSKPGRGFFYKEFTPSEQNKIHEILFCLLKYAIEKRGLKAFQIDLDAVTLPVLEIGHAKRADSGALAAALTRETLYAQLAAPLGNPQFSKLVFNLCERTRISRILWLEHRSDDFAAEELQALLTLLRAGKNQEALDRLQKGFEAKALKMHALANARQHRIYEAFPLLRPGTAR